MKWNHTLLCCVQAADPRWLEHVPSKLHSYSRALLALLRFSWQQATRQPTGMHADFITYGIDALTIRAIHDPQQVKPLPIDSIQNSYLIMKTVVCAVAKVLPPIACMEACLLQRAMTCPTTQLIDVICVTQAFV